MKRFIQIIIFCIFVSAVFCVLPERVFASVTAYKVTDGFQVTSLPSWQNGYVFFYTYIALDYGSGKVMLSRNPDGTGVIDIGESIQVINDFASQGFTYPSPSTCYGMTKTLPSTDITYVLNYGRNNLLVRLASWCTQPKSISSIYLVHIIDDPVSPTPTPTPTPSPTPAPFLDLPFDYQRLGKSFEDVALDPESWFDHQYPLQNIECCVRDIVKYSGERKADAYKSHSGYDYALQNGIVLNTPVLAAAAGWATFLPAAKSGGSGNVIKIDHANGYQTWYEHLSLQDLIVNIEGQKVHVETGQPIGKVGMSGNTNGPHIHLSVFKDANVNHTFDDDYPFGLVDPLGWEGKNPDPWTEWTSNDRTGSKSYNLFIARAQPKVAQISSSGGIFNANELRVAIPTGTFSTSATLKFNYGPAEKVSDTLVSLGPSFFLNAVDSLGQKITQFTQPLNMTYAYANKDLFNINEDTLKMYYFNELTGMWEVLPTIVDKANKTIAAITTHFSQFAVMGAVVDTVAPMTIVDIQGEKGHDNWYRSSVVVKLTGADNPGGLGMEYTLYSLNGSDWFAYSEPLVFTDAGSYAVEYQSYDKANNKEDRKKLAFTIDKTPPEARIFIDPNEEEIFVEGIDANTATVAAAQNPYTKNKYDALYSIVDQAGNTLVLDVRDRDKDNRDAFRIFSLNYNQQAFAQPDNQYLVTYKGKKGKQNIDEQSYTVEKDTNIHIQYDSKNNQSIITTKGYQQKKIEEVKNGLILLQLDTENGTLKYSY